jgi:DNA-binding transcriptional LysR family regulator
VQDLNDLYFFAQVIEKGGFAAAGRALGIPKSRLSRRLTLLEERLGVRLLQRSTRQLALTEIGQVYFQHCQAMLTEAQAAQDAIDHVQAEPRGTVRVSCPVTIAQSVIAPILPRFLATHPDVRMHIDVTNRAVDVIEEGFDLAIRVRRTLDDSSLVARSFGISRVALTASPRFLERTGKPRSIEELARLDSLSLPSNDGRYVWYLSGPDGASVPVLHSPRLVADDMLLLKQAAVEGLGIVLLPAFMCWEELRDRTLEIVLPELLPRPGNLHGVYPSRRGLVPAVRSFIDFLAGEMPPLMEALDAGFSKCCESQIEATLRQPSRHHAREATRSSDNRRNRARPPRRSPRNP